MGITGPCLRQPITSPLPRLRQPITSPGSRNRHSIPAPKCHAAPACKTLLSVCQRNDARSSLERPHEPRGRSGATGRRVPILCKVRLLGWEARREGGCRWHLPCPNPTPADIQRREEVIKGRPRSRVCSGWGCRCTTTTKCKAVSRSSRSETIVSSSDRCWQTLAAPDPVHEHGAERIVGSLLKLVLREPGRGCCRSGRRDKRRPSQIPWPIVCNRKKLIGAVLSSFGYIIWIPAT